MTHDELQAKITALCDEWGLYWHHEEVSVRSKPGWVDLVILGRSGLFPSARFAEIKSQDGRRSKEQIECGLQITRAGLDYRLWRPSDWESGAIQADLEELR